MSTPTGWERPEEPEVTEVTEAAEGEAVEAEIVEAEAIEEAVFDDLVEQSAAEDPTIIADVVDAEIVEETVAEPTAAEPTQVEEVVAETAVESTVVEEAVAASAAPEPSGGPLISDKLAPKLTLPDAEPEAPTPTDFSVEQPPQPTQPGPAAAPSQAGGSWLDLPPMPDIPSYHPGAYANPTPAAPAAYSNPTPSAPASYPPYVPPTVYGEQAAAQAYGHGTVPLAQPAPQQAQQQPYYPPVTSPDPTASWGQPGAYGQQVPGYGQPAQGYGLAPYAPYTEPDTMMASMAHWLPLAIGAFTGGVFGWLGPLIIMQTKGRTDSVVRANAVESLNFNLTVLIGMLVSIVLSIVVVGIVGLIVIPVVALILQILGAIAAARGEVYRYPFSIKFVK